MSSRGSRLIEAMRTRGVNKQHALAFALGVNESNITRWKENGQMSLDHAISLCRELDISLDWFLTGVGSMDQHKRTPDTSFDVDEPLWSVFQKVSSSLTTESRSLLITLIHSIIKQ